MKKLILIFSLIFITTVANATCRDNFAGTYKYIYSGFGHDNNYQNFHYGFATINFSLAGIFQLVGTSYEQDHTQIPYNGAYITIPEIAQFSWYWVGPCEVQIGDTITSNAHVFISPDSYTLDIILLPLNQQNGGGLPDFVTGHAIKLQ